MVMQPLPTRLVLQKKKAKEGRFGDDVEHYPVPSRITVRRGSVVSVEEVKDSVGVSSSHVCILYLFHLTDPLQYIFNCFMIQLCSDFAYYSSYQKASFSYYLYSECLVYFSTWSNLVFLWHAASQALWRRSRNFTFYVRLLFVRIIFFMAWFCLWQDYTNSKVDITNSKRGRSGSEDDLETPRKIARQHDRDHFSGEEDLSDWWRQLQCLEGDFPIHNELYIIHHPFFVAELLEIALTTCICICHHKSPGSHCLHL